MKGEEKDLSTENAKNSFLFLGVLGKVPLLPQILNQHKSFSSGLSDALNIFNPESYSLSSQLLCNTMSHSIDYSWLPLVEYYQWLSTNSSFPKTQQTKDSNKLNFSESKDLVRFFYNYLPQSTYENNSKYKPIAQVLVCNTNKIRFTSAPLSFICSSIMEYLFLFLPTEAKGSWTCTILILARYVK